MSVFVILGIYNSKQIKILEELKIMSLVIDFPARMSPYREMSFGPASRLHPSPLHFLLPSDPELPQASRFTELPLI